MSLGESLPVFTTSYSKTLESWWRPQREHRNSQIICRKSSIENGILDRVRYFTKVTQWRTRRYNTEACSCRHSCSVKAINITRTGCCVCVCVCVCCIGIQHPRLSRRIILTFFTCLALQYFSTLFHKRHDFLKKKSYWSKMCDLIFCTTFIWNISHSKIIKRDIIISALSSSCKVPVSHVRFKWNLSFLNTFFKNIQISNFMKIHSVGAELSHVDGRTGWRADRQTDMTEPIVAFRIFTNAPTDDTTLKPTKWDLPFLFIPGKMYLSYFPSIFGN